MFDMQTCQNAECSYVFLSTHKSCPRCGTPVQTEFGKLVERLMKVRDPELSEKLLEDAGIEKYDKAFSFLKEIEE
jgi:DNA-directed RNA polymerase subunit N (RpoN/RPB10)